MGYLSTVLFEHFGILVPSHECELCGDKHWLYSSAINCFFVFVCGNNRRNEYRMEEEERKEEERKEIKPKKGKILGDPIIEVEW